MCFFCICMSSTGIPFHVLMCLCVIFYYRLDGKLQAAERQHVISHRWTVDSAEYCYAKEALVTRKNSIIFQS